MSEIKTTKSKLKQAWPHIKEGIARDLVVALKRACPVDTGTLRNSIRFRTNNEGFEVYMKDYALFVEFGTAPHIITPKNAKALHFKDQNGKDIFAKVVHHPGTNPQPFIRNTLRTQLAKIIKDNFVRRLQ